MCRVLAVAPSGFYAWRQRTPSTRATRDLWLRQVIRAIHAQSRGRYGRPRIHHELQRQGIRIGAKRVGRLLQVEGLQGKRARRFVRSPASPASPRPANHLARRFAVSQVPGPDRIWVADATACWTQQGWLYLAVVLDLASRRVVGWAAGPRLDQDLAAEALARAVALRQPAPGWLHHSDQGVTYTGTAYQALLAHYQSRVSFSRRGNCWDNAVVESFFATLKTELVRDAQWGTRAQARVELAAYLDGWYNFERQHSSLGYLSPAAYERQQRVA
jgi:transposase InsO family protein